MSTAAWNAALYDDQHSFVWKLSGDVLGLLDARAGERVLDLGAGTGHLAQQLAERGVQVVGLDASATMVAKARASYPDLRFEVGDGCNFELAETFDAVFSNAALHWMIEQEQVFRRVFEHLRAGGRFVFEMGGARNVLAIRSAIAHSLHELGAPVAAAGGTKTYLSVTQACALLDRAGFEVTHATWTDRPTPLHGQAGLRTWIEMFGSGWLAWVKPEDRERFFALVEDHARAELFRDGVWIADYKRLRVRALRPG
jgi:trans-aconitate 2-methyltransferase